jgi:DNA-binding NarL/FixJ family response regulator
MTEAEFEEKYLAITKFQRPILTRFLRGESDTEIASGLGSTKENVRQHISKICQVLVLPNLLCQNTTKFSIYRIKNTT